MTQKSLEGEAMAEKKSAGTHAAKHVAKGRKASSKSTSSAKSASSKKGSSAKHAKSAKGGKSKKKLTKKQELIRHRVKLVAIIAAIVCAIAVGIRLFIFEPTVSGTFHGAELPSAEAIETSPYDWSFLLRGVDGRLHYVVSGTEESRSGIDVSAHQGDINWHKVRADGISFAIIRLGYRGTESGAIQLDERFRQNLLGAQMAGLNIGVYFYSQATTVAEAEEEADFVLSELGATQLVYPVVFDFEPTGSDGARISGMSADEMFAVAKAFCDRIAASGRTAMLYGNYYDLQDMEYTGLWQYGYWLASYTDLPSADIPFAIWQYSAEGTVSGIDGYVDLDIDLSKVLQASLA